MEKNKYRGITSGSGKWVYGDLIHLDDDTLIAGENMFSGKFANGHIELEAVSVWPNSIGVFTGLFDKNGKEIYFGDIVKTEKLTGDIKQFKGGQLYINHPDASEKYCHQIHCEVCDTRSPVFFLNFFDSYESEVIGNIHQNPELL